MKDSDEKIPNPKELEKEIGDFLAKKFGGNVKIVSPIIMPQTSAKETDDARAGKEAFIDFNLKPEDLVSYLDQYIIRQEDAKSILATKICTHFNRIKCDEYSGGSVREMVGSIKNNVLMIGPTGVGKTYMIKLIAKKLGVPFVKGDATKFSETGYVGGDVEDLVRDLVREADGDIEHAQYGIIYIDEVDKIASSHNLVGHDVSRTGVQRALLKPLEETEVDLKVPHDPISVIQELERFRKTGKRDKSAVNTKNILFIMSGAFSDMGGIIKKRIMKQQIGFGANIQTSQDPALLLKHVKSEDLINYGFESEFVGRLPVKAIFEKLTEADLYEILKSPNNPLLLGKKLDFAAYGIDVKFENGALELLAAEAFAENTGARGLVSAIERALLLFEKKLPSTTIKRFPVTHAVIKNPKIALDALISQPKAQTDQVFEKLADEEIAGIKAYVAANKAVLSEKYALRLTSARVDVVAAYYGKHIMDVGNVIQRIKSYYDEIKQIELRFFQNHDINIVLEEDAVDYIIEQFVFDSATIEQYYQKIADGFKDGLKLIQERSGKNRFFITKSALFNPNAFLDTLVKNELQLS